MKPVLAIVVLTLNKAAGIEATLQALQPLRTRGVELMLADGASSDALRAVEEADLAFVAALEAEQARQQPPQKREAL